MTRLADFAVSRFGDPFAPAEVLKIGLRVALGKANFKLPPAMGPRNEFICSEYVAKCYAAAGIDIPWDGLGFIAPADFANDPKTRALAQFDMRSGGDEG